MSEKETMAETHDCGGEVAAYLLGALEPGEAELFRRHLDQCVVCRDELEALTGVVQALPLAAPQVSPPKSLRRRVLRAARNEPKLSPQPSRRVRLAWPVPRIALATLGAAVVAAALIVTGVELSSSGAGGRVIQAQVSGISGSAQLRVNGSRGELIVHHLTPPPAGRVYEVWLKAPGARPVPASVLFTVNASGAADVGLPAELRGISQVMVTAEPRGGSPMPTHAPVIVASLT
jgi:anti-sigma-K factor RskA